MDENLIAFHKFQLTPITPTLAVPGSKLEKLHNKMMAQGMDYVVFQSGSKVSTITSVQFNDKGEAIRDKEGNIESIADDIYNDERQITDNDFTVNTIYVDYLKNQLKIEPKFKKNVTIPTQIRKLIMVDLMENGIPTDFQPGEELESRIEAWFNLTDAEQEAASNNYKKLRTYEKSVEKLSQIKMMQLIRKANLKLNEDGSLSGDLTNLIKFVKSQLSTQDIADHELDFIDVDLKNKSVKRDLSYSLSADKIERLLNALVVKSLVKQKAKGESLIQVASAMLEGEPQFKNPTKEELLQYGGTNGLTYYRINEAKGTIDAMKIKIAMQGDFEKLLYLPDVMVTKNKVDSAGKVLVRNGKPVKELDYNASLKKLNQLIKDDSWLDKGDNRKMVSMHGDRIPIQGLNSDEFAEVYEFLPKEAGNIIILPAEIVAKSGGDFDIDKLTLLMPNIGLSSKTIDGEVVYSVGLYKALDQKEYADRYEQYKQAFVEKYLTQGFTEDYDKFKALQLHYQLKFDISDVTGKFQIFGGSEAEVIASVIEMALEEGDLLTFDEFILADEEKVAQNEFLFALNALSSSIENYSNLVRPNGTDIFDEIVDNARSVYRDYTPKYTTNDETYSGDYGKGIQPSRVFEISYNLFKHMTNNFGKKALGIGAIDNTYNELMNRVGMYLTPNNRELLKGVESDDMAPILERARKVDELNKLKKEVDDYNKDKKGADKKQFDYNAWKQAREAYTKDDQEAVKNFVRQTLYLPHNTMRVKDSSGNWYKDRAISMSHIMDAAGENKIGDVISQMMNGWVDVAKEPWIFYVRGDEKLGPILLFLVQAGVPIRHAVNLISQPVIVEYMETISKLQSQFSEAMGNKDEDNTITRDRAILKAKEIMMSKLGYEIKGTDPNKKIQNLTQTIAEESTYVLPKVLNKDKQFDINDLEAQNKHVYDKYKMFDPKTGQPIKGNKQVDYSDPFINDYQKSVFLHFLQIVDMESSLKDVKLRTNVDTAKSGNLYEAENKILQLQELKRARQDSKTQTKYWRIPSTVIDRMIPTIKDEMGEDTGKLDRSKTGSILSSFYVQPFQLEMWKNLFPIRNNNTINKFLTDLSFTDKDDAKRDTYFSTDEKLIGEFKSALIPMIFQNSFLGYDLDTEIKNAEGGPMYFRGIEVRLESVGALQVGAQVKYETPSDAVLYYDYNSLYSQFQKSTYATDQYGKMGLSKLDANSFKSFNEYVKFVFEREYLRAQYVGTGSKKDIKKLQEDKEYKEIFRDTVRMVKRKTLADGSKESTTEWNKKRHRVAFERYIKNKALQNSYNMHAMFNGETAFAYEVASIKTDKRFEGIVDVFPVLKNLVPDTEQSKSSSTERVNLAFLDAPADSQMVNSYYEQLQDLANEVSLKKLMPNLSIDDINDIATVFRKLPIVAFLQSGMSSVGRFSLTRVIDQDTVVTMSEGAVNDFLNKINNDGPENPTLRSYWKAFVSANKKYDARGKNYVIQTDGKGTEVADITDAVFVKTDTNLTGTGKVYDVAFIDDNGVPVRKFSRIGDKLKVIRTYDNVDKSSEIVIDNIEWQDNRVVITASNPTNNSTFEFQYNAEGVLTQHTQADGTVKTNPRNIRTSAVITDDLINSLTDANLNLTQPGNIVDVMFVISGNTTVSPSEVLSIEDLGFRAAQTASGLVYENEDYYFNVKLKNAASEKLYDYVVNQRGEIVGTVNDAGSIMGKYNGNKIAMKLPQARMLGDKVVRSVAEAEALVAQGVIPPGTWVDVLEQHPKLRTTISTLGIIDPTTFKFTPVDTAYEDMDEGPEEITEEDSQFFLVYNGVVKPGASLAQEGSSATVAPGGKGKIDLRDRFIHHGLFNNKVGLTTRLSYRGGQMNEFITDDIDPVTGVASINPEVKEAIDNEIQQMLVKQEAGFKPMFNKSGYGQYMIGANDTTNEIIGDPVAKETFIYLSKQLLENFGYINPNFIAKAEGLKEIVKVTKQPVSDEQFRDMMNKCFNL
jgi:hypothetical protein